MKREIMKREIMKKKLSDLQCEIGKIKDDVDDYTREYLSKMEKIIEEYKNKLDSNKMDESDFIVKSVESGSKAKLDYVTSNRKEY